MKAIIKNFLFILMLCSLALISSAEDNEQGQVIDSIDFSVVNNDDISGLIKFWENGDPAVYKAEFLIFNGSGEMLDFRAAKYYAKDSIEKAYRMNFERIQHNNGGMNSPYLNPDDSMQLLCTFPGHPEKLDIQEVHIFLMDGTNIIFKPNPKLIKK